LQLARRFHLPALLCAFAVLLCELIAHPYTTMGVCDDGPYILIAQKLAATGHIVYNGNTTPFLGWQLYLAAAFIKLFGFSFTAVRMSTLLVAVALAFLLQRTLVRAGITGRNATLSTFTLVLSPLYLMMSVTFMTDITGLFGILLCLYGCLRALQSHTDRTTLAWLCFAIFTNAIFGSSRQIAWLGILVMVPSALWLLRAKRQVLLAGIAANLTGALFILTCILWFLHQPYNVHEPLLVKHLPIAHTLNALIDFFLDVPFLLLPIVALFLPQIRKCRPHVIAIFSASLLLYLSLAMLKGHLHLLFPLEPTQRDWVNIHGMYEDVFLRGAPPILLHKSVQVLLTIASFSSVFGLITSWCHTPPTSPTAAVGISWRQLGMLFVPFTIAYSLLLIPRSTTVLLDRYLLPLLLIATLCLVRYYQDRVHPQLPLAILALVALMAVYGIIGTHNTFAFDRARVALATEIRASGISDTSVDNGWEYNILTELQHANHINDSRIVIPAHAYVPPTPLPPDTCKVSWSNFTPHVHPLYGVSFDPDACYGPAPFAPVPYSRWPYRTPGTLYVVNYLPPSKP
jgi:hypothetical protein